MRYFLFAASLVLFFTTIQAQKTFVHVSGEKNIGGNSTFLNEEGLNNNPNAIIIVEADENARVANPHPVGVWYTGSQWAVFNQDIAAMPPGVKFTITWSNPDNNSFYQKFSKENQSGGKMLIDNDALNNNPSASFYVSQVWNPGGIGGVYNNSNITVEFEKQSGKWAVLNLNQTGIADRAAFNIMIVSGAQAKNGNGFNKPVTYDPKQQNEHEQKKEEIINVFKTNPANPVNEIKDINNAVKTPRLENPATNTPIDIAVNPTQLANAAFGTNFGFEFQLFNWTATGTAFNNQPVEGNTVRSERVLNSKLSYSNGGIGGDYWKDMFYPIGFKETYWIGTFENGNGDNPTGTLMSRQFPIKKRYLHFLLGGGKDINRLYVELQIKKSDYEAVWGAGRSGFFGDTDDGFTKVIRITSSLNSEEMFRYYFDLSSLLDKQFENKTARIVIVDNATGSWGHINVDDFKEADNLDDLIPLMRDGFSLYADKDKPVWGFADTHAHWVNNIGLMGLMHGSVGRNYSTSNVRLDINNCDGFNHNLPTITPGMLIAQTEKAAMNRISERLLDPGNALCMAGVVATGIVLWPSGVATLGGAGVGAGLGALGTAVSGASAGTGTLDGLITGAVWGLATNPAFQVCGYLFTKDVLAKHYNNNIPDNRPEVSNYVDFPRWNTMFHQTMHITWVRRSYEGGQRLMVVPVGVAKSWEFNVYNDGHFVSSKIHIENEINELKRIVNANSDWLAIAYTPREARQIILNNKMAIVIALEQAEVGNYFPAVNDEVNWLYNLGVRHVFPIHNINNRLGGAAVFNSSLNSYNDLVNRPGPDDMIIAFNVKEGETHDETRTTVKLGRTFMRQNLRLFPVIGFGTIPFFYSNDVPADYNYPSFISHKNRRGLLPRGEQYINELMKKGMIIEVDHMSDDAQQTSMQLLNRYHYPMISGHSNFRELRRDADETGGGDKEARLKTEFTIYDSRVNDISNAGGMFGIMTQQNNIRAASGCPVPNNSAGGSSSFAQAYWYLLQKTGGQKGIAFGSDFNGFAPQIAPRFGTEASYMLEGDDKLNFSIQNPAEYLAPLPNNRLSNVGLFYNLGWYKVRRNQAFSQTNGVRYDSPIKTYHYHRFQAPSFLTWEERDIWEAIAIAKSGTDPEQAWQPGGFISPERTFIQQQKIKNIAHGFRTALDNTQWLDCPDYILKGECPNERKAAFMAVHGLNALLPSQRDETTMSLYVVMKRIYDLWMQFENGPNEPIRRSFAYTGGRDFDFNLDGLAHYGMYPDLIQDLKNNGFSPDQLRPLFMATEQYLKMWEQADAAKANVRN